MTSTIPTLFPSLVALSHPNENVLTNECLGPVSAQLSHKGGGGGAPTLCCANTEDNGTHIFAKSHDEQRHNESELPYGFRGGYL